MSIKPLKLTAESVGATIRGGGQVPRGGSPMVSSCRPQLSGQTLEGSLVSEESAQESEGRCQLDWGLDAPVVVRRMTLGERSPWWQVSRVWRSMPRDSRGL